MSELTDYEILERAKAIKKAHRRDWLGLDAKPRLGGPPTMVGALPPGPYSYQTTAAPGQPDGKGHVYIVDATGKKLASLWGPAQVKMALAELIIRARADETRLSRYRLHDAPPDRGTQGCVPAATTAAQREGATTGDQPLARGGSG